MNGKELWNKWKTRLRDPCGTDRFQPLLLESQHSTRDPYGIVPIVLRKCSGRSNSDKKMRPDADRVDCIKKIPAPWHLNDALFGGGPLARPWSLWGALGPLGRLWGLSGASLGPLWGALGPLGRLWAIWARLGRLWSFSGVPWSLWAGRPGSLWGASGTSLGCLWGLWSFWGASEAPLGPLGRLWGIFGASGVSGAPRPEASCPGASGAALGRLWGLWGTLEASLGPLRRLWGL